MFFFHSQNIWIYMSSFIYIYKFLYIYYVYEFLYIYIYIYIWVPFFLMQTFPTLAVFQPQLPVTTKPTVPCIASPVGPLLLSLDAWVGPAAFRGVHLPKPLRPFKRTSRRIRHRLEKFGDFWWIFMDWVKKHSWSIRCACKVLGKYSWNY